MTERSTDDPIDPETLRADVARVLGATEAGGVCIVPLDVAYGVVAQTEAGVRRIFEAKRRSYEKPSGMFADAEWSRALHILPEEKRAMIDTLIAEEGLPFSVVAPFRDDHPLLARVEPFVLASSSKAGTMDMLLNAGRFHNALARQARERGQPVFGSSANTSLQGSKYRVADIEPEVRAAAALEIDHGRSKYANGHGRSSTIIDFSDFSVVRVGVCFDRLRAAFRERFDITLTDQEGKPA